MKRSMKKHFLGLGLAIFSLTSCGLVSNHNEISGSELIDTNDELAYLVDRPNGLKANDSDVAVTIPDQVTIHYHRDDNSYDDKRIWLWSPTSAPETEFEMSQDEDGWSYSYTFNPKELLSTTDTQFSFMVKVAGTWAGKSAEYPITYADYPPVQTILEDGSTIYTLDIYAVANGTNLNIYKTKEDAISDQITNAFISNDFKKINIYTKDGTGDGISLIDNLRIYKFTNSYYGMNSGLQVTYKDEYLLYSATDVNKQNIAIQFENTLTINCNYVIEISFVGAEDKTTSYTIPYDNLYETAKFKELSYDDDDLGATINKEEGTTTFKVWAPTASKMELKVYDYGYDQTYLYEEEYENTFLQTQTGSYQLYDMSLNPKTFVWECTIDENLEGKYYLYRVYNTLGTADVVDPYAKSASVDGNRGMIVDFDSEKATPENWNQVPEVWDKTENFDIETSQELVVSENHIRDLTMNETWGGTKEKAGTFSGFIEEGTTYTINETNEQTKTVKTGYDHLVEYGVNAIQLLPIFDQDNAERARKEVTYGEGEDAYTAQVVDYSTHGDFNWGYNPLNYNVLEGAYSSDPRDGYARIKEFRELVAKFALNENHTRIIMDVVYNHVSSAPTSNFEKLMPKYYSRYNIDGSYSDASGCGNEVKTEAPMMRKFIVDSVCFWAETYKIRGFRFDLMVAIDIGTISDVADALYEIYPYIYVYGEGWNAGVAGIGSDQLALNNNLATYLYPGRDTNETEDTYEGRGFVAGFNNGGRDALKGDNGFNSGVYWGFIGKGENDLASNSDLTRRVQLMMMGANGYDSCAWDPRQNVNYVSCHDNFTLFDQLNWILSDDGTEPNIEVIAKASATVNGMVLMSNGISFINGGEEIFRTKIEDDEEIQEGEVEMYGKRISHNSYQSSDFTNSYDYRRKAELEEYFQMYCELVDLKKNLDFSQEVVSGDTNTFKSGDNNIESANTHGGQIGVYRKTKDGKGYHIYLVGRTENTTFYTNGTVIFNNTNLELTPTMSGMDIYNSRYSLVIIED